MFPDSKEFIKIRFNYILNNMKYMWCCFILFNLFSQKVLNVALVREMGFSNLRFFDRTTVKRRSFHILPFILVALFLIGLSKKVLIRSCEGKDFLNVCFRQNKSYTPFLPDRAIFISCIIFNQLRQYKCFNLLMWRKRFSKTCVFDITWVIRRSFQFVYLFHNIGLFI